MRLRICCFANGLRATSQIATFEREGWLLVKDFIPHKDILALQEEIAGAIDDQARKLQKEGKITELHEDKDYLHRTAAIWDESPEIWNPVFSGNHAGKAMFELLSCSEILDIMEQLVGPEIIAAGIYRLRPKLPGRPEGIVPWHQVSVHEQHFWQYRSMAERVIWAFCGCLRMPGTLANVRTVMPAQPRQGVQDTWVHLRCSST